MRKKFIHNNKNRVITLLNREGALSRKDIASKLNISTAAVTNLIDELKNEKWVKEIGQKNIKTYKAGRRQILIDVIKDKLIIGLYINKEYLEITISNIKLEELSHETHFLTNKQNTYDYLNEITQIITQHINKNVAPNKAHNILGISLNLIDTEHIKNNDLALLINGEENILEYLEEHLSLPITYSKNIESLSFSEIIHQNNLDYDNILFIKAHKNSLETSFAINKEFYQEIFTQKSDVHKVFTCFNCGEKKAFHKVFSLKSFQEQLQEFFNPTNMPHLYEELKGNLENITIKHILDPALMICKNTQEIQKKRLNFFVNFIHNMQALFNAEKIVTYGDVFTNENLSTIISQSLNSTVKKKLKLYNSHLNNNNQALPSCGIGIRDFFIVK